MSEQDKSLLDEQMALVRAVYRALPDEEIPAEIEQRVLANAAAALKNRPSRRWLAWSGPLASAAVVLLVVAVVMDPQSGSQSVPEPVASMATRQAAVQESVEPAVPRKAAEKPDVTMRAEQDRVASAESQSLPASAPPPVTSMAYSPPASEMSKREAGPAASAVRAQAMLAQELSEQEQEVALAAAPSRDAGGVSGAAAPSDSERIRAFADVPSRRALMSARPASPAGGDASPLDISPELRARLEKFLQKRQKEAAASDPDPTLDELRREYPGVDIDAALRALERLKGEGAQ